VLPAFMLGNPDADAAQIKYMRAYYSELRGAERLILRTQSFSKGCGFVNTQPEARQACGPRLVARGDSGAVAASELSSGEELLAPRLIAMNHTKKAAEKPALELWEDYARSRQYFAMTGAGGGGGAQSNL
jgi:hypothetical protein